MATLAATVTPGDRAWRTLTWLIFAATVASLLIAIWLWAGIGFAVPPITFYQSTWIVALEWVLIVTPGAVGLLLGLRLPGNRIALLFAALGLLIALQNVADMLVGTPSFAAGPYGAPVAWVASTFVFPVAIMIGILVLLLFPDGRLISPNWGLVPWLAGIGCALLIPYQGFAPGTLSWYHEFPNPFAVAPGTETWLLVSRFLGVACIGAGIAFAGWSILTRYRGADEVLRQQLKWFAYGTAVLVVAALAQIVAFVTLAHDHPVGELTLAGLFIGGALLPVAAAVAITQYGLYEIDVLISRTFVFGALTAVLAGLYAAGIRFFQVLFVAVTGQESDAALVLTTLVLATTFTPIKQRLEAVAARRFHTPAADSPPPAADPALRALITDVVREELARRDKP